jgi:hypothetical protein
VAEAERQLIQEVSVAEEPLDAMALLALGVQLENGRRPLDAEADAESLVIFRLLSNVDTHRDEVLGDETNDFLIGIDLGIQPSASRSHRGGAEIQQHHAPSAPGLFQRAIEIASPRDVHDVLLS